MQCRNNPVGGDGQGHPPSDLEENRKLFLALLEACIKHVRSGEKKQFQTTWQRAWSLDIGFKL